MTTERLDLVSSGSGSHVQRDPDDLIVEVDEAVVVAGQGSWYARLQAHRRTWTAIRGFREILLIAAVYTMYDLTRFLVEGKTSVALGHGRSLLKLEKTIGVAPEHVLNRLFTAHLALGLPADYVYATLHYIVTPVVLVWMWRRHSASYAPARTVLMLGTILALVGYSLFPVAPPRLLPGFLDTMAKFSHYGWWGTAASAPRGLGGDTNQFAAMPSLHVGWAIWCGWMLVRHGRHRRTKVVGVAYPLVLAFDVMATANHYLLDLVGGVVVMAVAYGLVRLLSLAGIVSFPKPGTGDPSPPVEPAPA